MFGFCRTRLRPRSERIAHTDPGNNQWANATFFSGLTALYRLTSDTRYLAYARSWAERNNYGLNGGTTTRNADTPFTAPWESTTPHGSFGAPIGAVAVGWP